MENETNAIANWLSENKEWAWAAIIGVLSLLFGVWKHFFPRDKLRVPHEETTIESAKKRTNILFVDDDTSFKVVDILKAAGWLNTSIQEDIDSLDEQAVVSADIVFVDIQGVGKKLGFKDDGLGLTTALKERHSHKHVVVYSSETRGNRFHKGLKAADDFLAKNAEPYEFQKIVEDYVLRDS